MKSGQQRSVKAGGSKRKVPSDVSPSTSLPPLVEGQLRCFLRVTISRLVWTIHKPPSATFVKLRWWGESSNGTHFFPRDGSQLSQKTVKTTAHFPIRCGPKQFTSYLTDMGSLVLDVLTKPDNLPIARAQVSGISRLSLSHPVSGFYTLVSPTSEKLGELQVSLNLEALTEAYDGSSPGPTTDMTGEGLQAAALNVSLQPRSFSAGSGKESAGSSSGNTPRGKDHLYFKNVKKGKEESVENQMPTAKGQMALNSSSQEPCGQTTNDILAVILEHGNKMRNAMVVSALKCDMDSSSALKDTPLPLPKDNILQHSKPSASSSGTFLQNILHADSTVKHSEDAAATLDYGLDCLADIDNRAVNLLLGSINTSSFPLWDGENSLCESLSGHSSVCVDSELNDPQYDQSLLENLFYKTPMPDIGPNDTQGESQGTVSSSKKQLTQSGVQISEGSNSEPPPSTDTSIAPGLSEEQLTLLSFIRLARVTISSLTVPTGSTTTPRKTFNRGRPPRPLASMKCTYFVEYLFPMGSISIRHKGGDGEATRAVASTVTEQVVNFHHHSVFPVHISTATIKQWWGTDLIFKIYSRKSDQKKPVLIGKAVHPLRFLLQSKQLSQSVVLPVQTMEGNKKAQEVGPLKVSLELSTHSKAFSSDKSKMTLAHRDKSTAQTAFSPQRETCSNTQHVDVSGDELPSATFEDSRLDAWSPQRPSKESFSQPCLQTSHKSQQQLEENPTVLLHTLLMVPDGKNFSCGPMQGPNVYLNCKLFWSDEMTRSIISWGQTNPSFNFVQVTPVALSTKLLERMRNNMMVIEVWQKTGSSRQDRLFGLVKLPLHQFYMSFRDPKIAHLLLQAQYPVLGVDCYMPVIDVFSSSCKGNLRVVLAMGLSEQIASLQRMRNEDNDSLTQLVRPAHLLDHQPHSPSKEIATQNKATREHLFVIKVERVNGLTPLQSTVWGEADCYVQYSFPSQEGGPDAQVDQNLIESSVNLKLFRTTTTLCVPDPVFGHTETHVLLAPEGMPVQRLLLGCLSCQGLSGGGGVQFEVWCRYYYPNVRDQLVAKGMLPLSKLCAMVTMQRQHPNEAQIFSLPLIPRMDSPTGHQPQPSGLLDVCIRYKHRLVRPEGQSGKGAASRFVTLEVQVHRASGLQVAARVVSEHDGRFGYYASVGVNTYVTIQLSFLPESERRCTRIAARTFCPEFDHHMEVSCDLLVQRSSGETCSLAERLEEALAVFTVWNRDSHKEILTHKPKDVMLGTVKIPLADLLHKTTGISGWFGVYTPQETSSSQQQRILVGGLEISVNFAHHSDRERVIKAAQGVGWQIAQNEVQDNEDAWRESIGKMSLTFSMPRAWLPVHCLLLPGHTELQRSTYCYFRYKFYDQDAFCSQMKHPSFEGSGEEGPATVTFQGSRTVNLRSSPPLIWYLREEKLEVQVWVAFKKDKGQRPRDTDRLVGSAFVDLSSFAKTPKQKRTLSGVYPLFRRSAANLQGAALRLHVTLTADFTPVEESFEADTQVDSDSQRELFSEELEAPNEDPSVSTPKTSQITHKNTSSRAAPDITSVQHTEMSMDESFPVTVAVDRAMHLNLKGCPLAQQNEVSPCCCVSYVTVDSPEPVSTAVIANTDCPVWDHQHHCRLSKQLLVDPQQSLVFKVWHKGEMERVIGFASVDLSPLLCGFLSVCGWYHITDFSGQCHGQLKVSITPLNGVQDLREKRKTVNEETAKDSPTLLQPPLLSYHTTATYSSFPSHISRFPEQKISSPDHTDRLFSERSIESDRRIEHMDKVRHYHQSLQEQTASNSVCSSNTGDINPSSSFLFSALRKKLSELDSIQRYFSSKLSTPTFPSVREQDCHSKPEEQRDIDKCQLLFKSKQLVGEVNSLINGLQGQHLEMTQSHPQSSSPSSPVKDNSPQIIPEIFSSDRALNSRQDKVFTLPSPLQKLCEDHTDSELEEINDSPNYKVTESADENEDGADKDEKEAGSKQDKEADDDEDDFEEVVVKPRPLNEVTSLTDKTSPWTSILSDPEMVSPECLESTEELNLSQDEDDKWQMLSMQTQNLTEHKCSEQEGGSSSASERESSDTERDDKRTLNASNERRANEAGSPNEGSSDEGSSPTTQDATDTHDASSSSNQDSQLQLSVPVEVPNFFLPTHQLEETMRAIRLAPAFSQSTSNTKRSSPIRHRGPRHRRDMSPSSKKKETERIANIFAAHID